MPGAQPSANPAAREEFEQRCRWDAQINVDRSESGSKGQRWILNELGDTNRAVGFVRKLFAS